MSKEQTKYDFKAMEQVIKEAQLKRGWTVKISTMENEELERLLLENEYREKTNFQKAQENRKRQESIISL